MMKQQPKGSLERRTLGCGNHALLRSQCFTFIIHITFQQSYREGSILIPNLQQGTLRRAERKEAYVDSRAGIQTQAYWLQSLPS